MNNNLIDRNQLKAIYEAWLEELTYPDDEGDYRGVETCLAALMDEPAVDAEPVRHGRWEYNSGDNIPYCNQCAMPQDVPTNYCHECGAKMDGGNNNE